MTSRAFTQGSFFNPIVSSEIPLKDERTQNYRHPTVYDAVAGRISVAGFIPKQTVVSSTRDTASSSTTAVPPETVLYRRKSAPTRYAEFDVYFANERRSVTGLPESDLLKSLHCYASGFYSRAHSDGSDDFRSLDETALIALGILLEESSLAVLGKTGDLVFTEGSEIVDRIHADEQLSKPRKRPSKKRRLMTETT